MPWPFGLLIIALMFGAGIWINRKYPDAAVDEPIPYEVLDPAPPASVNAFMGREPDMSLTGVPGVADVAIWVKDGELYWCPFIRPATPADGQ